MVQRVRLALTLKGVSFDVINCDLKNKPLFFLEANPLGEVPVIIHDGVILTESEVCVGEIGIEVRLFTTVAMY